MSIDNPATAGEAPRVFAIAQEVISARLADPASAAPDYPDGTGTPEARERASVWLARLQYLLETDAKAEEGVYWANMLMTAASAAVAQRTSEALRAALIDVVTLLVSWVEAIDRRAETPAKRA